ncbi:S-type pyocin domain-containing protein [Pseudomonas paralactis]|uniref:S-type pyocin domain-containing protein n=1 Tax=Pseudomonas paralactis TaxID=1615673 RepID=UPI0030B88012
MAGEAEEVTWQDMIISFPAHSGVPPLYLVFAKPMVSPLEVGPYDDLSSRSIKDASDLSAAVDSNFNAIKRGLLEEGFTEADVEVAREQLHRLSKEQGWY